MCGVDDIGEGFDVEIDGRLDEFGGGRGGGQAEPVSGGDTQGAGGTVTATRYYSEGGATVAVRTNGGKQWLAADHQGSADLTINTTTATVQRRWYNPYGDNRATQGTWPTDRGFLDQQTNASTGLIYDGAREYDPVLGSFISADPLTDPGNPTNFNAYAYAGHNPITASDPSGLRYDSDVSGGDPDNGGFAITSGLFDMYERIYGKVPPRVEAANHAFRKVYERITSHRAPPHGPGAQMTKISMP